MNKNEFVEVLGNKLGVPRSESERIINTFIDVITETLKKGDELKISGFGSFSVSSRAAREGVNPQNPTQRIQIAAVKVPKFKAGDNLKKAVRGESETSASAAPPTAAAKDGSSV